jgi:hypothetical protein
VFSPGHKRQGHVAQRCCPACRITAVLPHSRSDAPPAAEEKNSSGENLFLFGVFSPGHKRQGHVARPCCPACRITSKLPHSRSDAPPAGDKKNSPGENFVFVWRVQPRSQTARSCGATLLPSMPNHCRVAALSLRRSSSGRQEKLPG